MEIEISTGAQLKQIRLRLGWCAAEVARHLSITVDEVITLEQNPKELPLKFKAACADFLRYADDYSTRIQQDPMAEKVMNNNRLSQVTGAALFHLNEKDFIE